MVVLEVPVKYSCSNFTGTYCVLTLLLLTERLLTLDRDPQLLRTLVLNKGKAQRLILHMVF